jgi:UDP-N-acetyl-D-galactosamine dehydrogenase
MKKKIIAIIGLGYVGLPLAVASSKKFKTIGFDVNEKRITELQKGIDKTKELQKKKFYKKKQLVFTNDKNKLAECNFFIIVVPTPVNAKNKPDLTAIKSATELVSKYVKKGDFIVYESTVYPGLTREVCLSIIEKNTKLIFNKDFWLGYSPERINPGDKKRTIYKIKKVTSGSNKYSAKVIDKFYKAIIPAGTFLAESIEVAEAAKVIENTQRDINIALINELSKIFNKLNISTKAVLEAASSKWNFMNFTPGLVGGHCIGVDPYYLADKATKEKCFPRIILAGRKINDTMYKFIFQNILKKIKEKKLGKKDKLKSVILGATFKDNCPDMRNSKIIDLYNILKKNKIKTFFYDPEAEISDKDKKILKFIYKLKSNYYDILIISNNHKYFKNIIQNYKKILKKKNIVIDLKNSLNRSDVDFSL